MKKTLLPLCSLLVLPALAAAAEDEAALLRGAAEALCPLGIEDPGQALTLPGGFAFESKEDLGPAGTWLRRTLRYESPEQGLTLTVEVTRRGETLQRVTYSLAGLEDGRPLMVALAGGDCAFQHARAIAYDAEGRAGTLLLYEADLATLQDEEPLNPPPPEGEDPGGVTVAHVDSGVNYLLPAIAARLARDQEGHLLGYDFWDLDERPFDGDTGRSPFFPIRHGTPVASLLVKEAPQVRYLPYRYPRPDMSRMGEVVEAAAEAGARIVALPMGSRDRADWAAFETAARAHPEILFVVSAGNDGVNLDEEPLWPASLDLENMLVVTSADGFGRLAQGSNWGPETVDIMLPAEQQEVIDYRGAKGEASGSSYAVPRLAALAARIAADHPDWGAAELKAAILARAVTPMERGGSPVQAGWIPEPAEDY